LKLDLNRASLTALDGSLTWKKSLMQSEIDTQEARIYGKVEEAKRMRVELRDDRRRINGLPMGAEKDAEEERLVLQEDLTERKADEAVDLMEGLRGVIHFLELNVFLIVALILTQLFCVCAASILKLEKMPDSVDKKAIRTSLRAWNSDLNANS